MEMVPSYDCIVIGGGPAGSTVAALVAAGGWRTLLIEQDSSPRRRSGDCLQPAALETLDRLGLLKSWPTDSFRPYRGVQFYDHEGALQHAACFSRSGIEASGWVAPHPAFDRLLFDSAVERGAEARCSTRAAGILFDGDRARGVAVSLPDGGLQEIPARVVVDAGGRQSLIARHFGLHAFEGSQRTALWGYYRCAAQENAGQRGMSSVFRSRHRRAWFWYTPLPEGRVNVGVIGDALGSATQDSAAAALEEELVDCPAVAKRLMTAELVSPLRVVRNYNYQARQSSGKGWLLAGDALAGVDPWLCAGVTLALKSGQWAADAIGAALAGNGPCDALAEPWVDQHRAAVRRLIRLAEMLQATEFQPDAFAGQSAGHAAALAGLLAGDIFSAEHDAALGLLAPLEQSASS